MNSLIHLIFLAALILLLVFGCGEQKQPAPQEEAKQTTMEDVKKEAGELVETTKSYTMEQKLAYEQELADKVALFEQQMAALKQQMAMTSGEVRDTLQAKVDSLQAKMDDMKGRAEELKEASGDAWDDLRVGLEKTGEDLEKAFSEAMENFRKSSSKY